jgi:hypothetical protein
VVQLDTDYIATGRFTDSALEIRIEVVNINDALSAPCSRNTSIESCL